MTARILIIGGYGNFGGFISRTLVRDPDMQVIVAGRSLGKADAFCRAITDAATPPVPAALDIQGNIAVALRDIAPDIVIHCSGPFQNQGYYVAEACIAQGCHYIDLADGREFVCNIARLNRDARKKGIVVVSGASSVPCLTGALVDHYEPEFAALDTLDYGIATAQKTNRGLATTAAILTYTGKPFETLVDGVMQTIHGWQGLRRRRYRYVGARLLGHCDVPDLALFPDRYPSLKTIRFHAGLEVPLLHLGLWFLSWLARAGLVRRLEGAAPLLQSAARLFDRFGSDTSAFHMELSGTDAAGVRKAITFELTARAGDGPYIPCIPSILLAQKLARAEITVRGAFPCVGLITLDEYLDALAPLDIDWDAW
jgi:saccharopine dehydrogenase-like NADP-dependent oxidoreductase